MQTVFLITIFLSTLKADWVNEANVLPAKKKKKKPNISISVWEWNSLLEEVFQEVVKLSQLVYWRRESKLTRRLIRAIRGQLNELGPLNQSAGSPWKILTTHLLNPYFTFILFYFLFQFLVNRNNFTSSGPYLEVLTCFCGNKSSETRKRKTQGGGKWWTRQKLVVWHVFET